jgi:hypothetical protein
MTEITMGKERVIKTHLGLHWETEMGTTRETMTARHLGIAKD